MPIKEEDLEQPHLPHLNTVNSSNLHYTTESTRIIVLLFRCLNFGQIADNLLISGLIYKAFSDELEIFEPDLT
jgi:hypothetical protein